MVAEMAEQEHLAKIIMQIKHLNEREQSLEASLLTLRKERSALTSEVDKYLKPKPRNHE